MLKAIGFDDWVIILTWIAAAGFAVVSAVREYHLESSAFIFLLSDR